MSYGRELVALAGALAVTVVLGVGSASAAGKPTSDDYDATCAAVSGIPEVNRSYLEQCAVKACGLRVSIGDLDFSGGGNPALTQESLESKAGGSAQKLVDAQERVDTGKDPETKITQARDLITEIISKIMQLQDAGKVMDGAQTVDTVLAEATEVRGCINDLL